MRFAMISFQITKEASQTKELLARCRERLYAERQKRPKPHRDDKILTAWNGQQFV